MDRFETLVVVLVFGLLFMLFSPLLGMGINMAKNPFPRCQEDAVIIGQGDFDDGRWEYYTCGPALDDYGNGG